MVKDLATHDIDLTAWVIQSPYAQVSAHTAHKSGREHEDLISVTAQMQDGTVASHLVNWLSPLKERMTSSPASGAPSSPTPCTAT